METIKGSDGLTLNLCLQKGLSLSYYSSLEFNVGVPVVVKKVIPEVLTRSFVFITQYNQSFYFKKYLSLCTKSKFLNKMHTLKNYS